MNTHFACKKVPYFLKRYLCDENIIIKVNIASVLPVTCYPLKNLRKKVDLRYELFSSASVIVIYIN